MIDYIYCREYGLQPALPNVNFGLSEANGNPPVIINQSVKNLQVPGNLFISMDRVLYKKCIVLSNFNGYDNLYIGKKSDFYFQNVPFDFVNDKWRIRGLHNSPLNNYKFNVYDRPQIRNIISNFLTRKQEDVFNLLYEEIRKSDGLDKFLNILSAVIELKDEFLMLLTPYEETFLSVPNALADGNNTNEQSGNESGLAGVSVGNMGKYWIGGGLIAIGLYALRKKKVI